MALLMARPWKDPKSGVWHLRQRVPKDLIQLKGHLVTLPVGDRFVSVKIGEVVQVSLRTKDQREAKERHAVADAALRRFWDSQRNNTPTRLSHQQAAALAGTIYTAFAETLERNPGSPERWALMQNINQMARDGKLGAGPLMIGKEAAQAHSMAFRFGPIADAVLRREGLAVDQDSRNLLIKALAHALDAAAAKLERNAEFDYSPDPAASRFPKWKPIEHKPEARKSSPTVSVADLWEQWKTYHADKKAPTTIERYEASLRSLATFTKGKAAESVTSDDLYAWAIHRRDVENISPKVVNQVDLVAASSVFIWASSRQGGKLIPGNPVTRDVRLDLPKVQKQRESTLRAHEITAILKAALAVKDDPKNPTSAFAKRWCPWLAAYSGARIQELTGLKVEDIQEEGGIWVMHFHKTKTGQPRTVPIHEHLIEMGFIDFVRSRKTGPLFYDPKRSTGKAKTLLLPPKDRTDHPS
ncbi:site-specific integrase [Microvirga soli]|uniref:site-specific integrase n=1 Tax=Microvirga soli TaxID=1854496 RepID=UPI00191E4516|nr:site-specific integrase [Microvirga soli]